MTSGHLHSPENAEYELRKAYNCVIESATTYEGNPRNVEGVNPMRAQEIYRTAYDAYRRGDRLIAERWARTTKHLSRALWHEAKIAFLEQHPTELPFLEGATGDEYGLHEKSDMTSDLLQSLMEDVPPGFDKMPQEMTHYIARGQMHLETLNRPDYKHELLRAERIKAAHEYGRVVEIMGLALEAEQIKKAA